MKHSTAVALAPSIQTSIQEILQFARNLDFVTFTVTVN